MAQDFKYKDIKNAGKYSKLGDEAIQRAKNDIGVAESTKQDIESINKVIEPIDKEIETIDKEIEAIDKEIEAIDKEIEAIDNNKNLSDAEKKLQKDAKENDRKLKQKEKDVKEVKRESRQKEKDAKEAEKEKIGAILFEDGSVRLENGDRVYSSTNVRLDDGTQVNPEEKDVTFSNGITYDKDRTITIPPGKDSNGNPTNQVVVGRYDYIQEVANGTYAWEKQWDDKFEFEEDRKAFEKDLATKYNNMKDAFSAYKKDMHKDMNADDRKKLQGSAANLGSKYNELSSKLKSLGMTDKQVKNVIGAWMPPDFEKVLEGAKGNDVYKGENSDQAQREATKESNEVISDKVAEKLEKLCKGKGPVFIYLVEFCQIAITGARSIATDVRLCIPEGARNKATDYKKRRDKQRKNKVENYIEYAESGSKALQKYADGLVEDLDDEINDPKNAQLKAHFDNFIAQNKHLDDIEDFKDVNKRQIVKKQLERKYRQSNNLSPEDQKILDYINALELQNIATNLTKTHEQYREDLETITALPKSDKSRRKQFNQYTTKAVKMVKSMYGSGLFKEIVEKGQYKLDISDQAQDVLKVNNRGKSTTIEQAKGTLPHEYEQDAGL